MQTGAASFVRHVSRSHRWVQRCLSFVSKLSCGYGNPPPGAEVPAVGLQIALQRRAGTAMCRYACRLSSDHMHLAETGLADNASHRGNDQTANQYATKDKRVDVQMY